MSKYRKGIVAAAGALASAVAAGLVPDPWDKWAMVVLAVCTAMGVYSVPNTTR
jgi:hypothetical protein